MNMIEQTINQKIYNEMTQIQVELEEVFRQIFNQAGGKINLEKQEEIQKEIATTKELLERFKSKYV